MIGEKWIGLRKGEINILPEGGVTSAYFEDLQGKIEPRRRSMLLRKAFPLTKKCDTAELRICGLGFYELHINGKKPDPARVLSPLYSCYFKRALYDTFNVSSLLAEGKNVICVELGTGWFCPEDKYWGWQNSWHGTPRMTFELTIAYKDGTTETVSGDETWKLADGAVVSSSIYDGETYDKRLEPESWLEYGFDDSGWANAKEVEAPTSNINECIAPPVRIINTVDPVETKKLSEDKFFYDFGTNNSALPLIRVTGPAGSFIKLNHAENIHEDGTLNTLTNNRAYAEDIYYLGGKGEEEYRPLFTWHGYRYETVTLSSPEIKVLSVKKCEICSDVRDTGTFSCDRDDLVQYHETVRRTQLSCLIGVPVDCPQRDERLPWLGDAHVTAEECLYNFDMEALYDNFLDEIKAGINPNTKRVPFLVTPETGGTSLDWNYAYPDILWESYRRYGNKTLLEKHFDALCAHTDSYIAESDTNGGRLPVPPTSDEGLNCWFGDWFSIDKAPGQDRVAFRLSPEGDNQNPVYGSDLFFYSTLRLTAFIADALGRKKEAEKYRFYTDRTRQLLLDNLYNKETCIFGNGDQFSMTYALDEEIIPVEGRAKALWHLIKKLEEKDFHSYMGVVGIRHIFDLLIKEDRPELAYKLLTREGFPGVLDQAGHGRTTLPEGLDGGGSGCHCMFGSPDAILYKLIGGITIDRTAKYPVVINPYFPGDIGKAYASQRIAEGTVVCSWERKDGKLECRVEIPKRISAYYGHKDCGKELTSGVHTFTADC